MSAKVDFVGESRLADVFEKLGKGEWVDFLLSFGNRAMSVVLTQPSALLRGVLSKSEKLNVPDFVRFHFWS